MNAESIVDAAIALTSLPPRRVALDDYGRDLDDLSAVQVCKAIAVRMARLGDAEACLLALQEAEKLVLRFGAAA